MSNVETKPLILIFLLNLALRPIEFSKIKWPVTVNLRKNQITVISIDDKQEYDKISEVANSYGDGKAERIVETLKNYELW